MGPPAVGDRLSRDSKPLGLLGGTFDPIHDGHLAIAAAVRVALDLDEVVFIPAGSPPHKPGQAISPAGDRRAMIELAIRRRAGLPAEHDRAGPAGPVLRRRHPGRAGPSRDGWETGDAARVHPVGGGVRRLSRAGASPPGSSSWPAWPWSPGPAPAARSGLARRPPAGLALTGRFRGRGPRSSISASTIRDRVRAGRSISGLVPPAVATYIHDHRLYTDPS